jgi:AAA15 family ATPase/GTPase
MIKSFSIENFRCFKNIEIDGFGQFNIITGMNNVGKTAFLEALFLHMGSTNPDVSLRLNAMRGILNQSITVDSLWSPLFFSLDSRPSIIFKSKDENVFERSLEMRLLSQERTILQKPEKKVVSDSTSLVTSSPPLNKMELLYKSPGKQEHRAFITLEGDHIKIDNQKNPDVLGIYINARNVGGSKDDVDRYASLDVRGEQDFVLRILKKVEPRLKRLSIVPSPTPMIYGDIGLGRSIPIQLMGGGTSRIFTLITTIASARNGFVLIDEIENGLHYSIMNNIFTEVLESASRFNVQIFVTTHSNEFIRAACIAAKGAEKDLKLFRLDYRDDSIVSTLYTQEEISDAIAGEWEVRG